MRSRSPSMWLVSAWLVPSAVYKRSLCYFGSSPSQFAPPKLSVWLSKGSAAAM